MLFRAAVSMAPGLTPAARCVGEAVIDFYNCETGRCDPGLKRIAEHAGVHRASVVRALQQLAGIGLMRAIRHGGQHHTNFYEVDWAMAETLARRNSRKNATIDGRKMRPSHQRSQIATQTLSRRITNSSTLRESEGLGRKKRRRVLPGQRELLKPQEVSIPRAGLRGEGAAPASLRAAAGHPPLSSAEIALNLAQQRLDRAIRSRWPPGKDGGAAYGAVLGMTAAIEAASASERDRPGSGIRIIEEAVRLPVERRAEQIARESGNGRSGHG